MSNGTVGRSGPLRRAAHPRRPVRRVRGPAPAGAGIFVTEWAFGTHLLALELLTVVALMGVTARIVWWIAGGDVKAELRVRAPSSLPCARNCPPGLRRRQLHGSLTALLYQRGLVGISPAPAHDHNLDVTFSFYLWHIAHTVPLLDITGNLGWQKPLELHGGNSAACS